MPRWKWEYYTRDEHGNLSDQKWVCEIEADTIEKALVEAVRHVKSDGGLWRTITPGTAIKVQNSSFENGRKKALERLYNG